MSVVADLSVVISANASKLNSGLNQAENKVKNFASSAGAAMTDFGGKVTAWTAPLTAAFGVAVVQAAQFDQTMTNTAAVMGQSRSEMTQLNAQILALGGESLAGPQKVADAFYDIVGAVADPTVRIALLNVAVKTSEAGASDLTTTTAALITVMNGYGLSADKAAWASDVMTQTVGRGVGTMDELAGALPPVVALAADMGINFNDIASYLALSTTKGFSFSEAGTQMRAAMVALKNPNETMIAGLKEIGFKSGDAAVEALGLKGTYDKLATTTVANTDGLAKMTGSVEALTGVMVLTDKGSDGFLDGFKTGLDGATEAAQKIQRESPAATFALMSSKAQELSITAGNVLLPVLQDIGDAVIPLVDNIIKWMNANPQLAGTMIAVAGGAVLLGPALMIVGTALKGVGIAFAVMTGPMLPVIIGLAGIAAGFVAIKALIDSGQFAAGLEGWTSGLNDAWRVAQMVFDNIKAGLTRFSLDIQLQLQTWIGSIRKIALDATGIDIAPNFVANTDALRESIAKTEIGDMVYKQLQEQMASGGPIDLTQAQTFTVNVGDAPVNIQGSLADALLDPAILADMGLRGKVLVQDALKQAFMIGDQQTVDLLTPVAVNMGLDMASLQANVAADIAAGNYDATVEAHLNVVAIVGGLQNIPNLISQAIGAAGGALDTLATAAAPYAEIPGYASGTSMVYSSGLAMIHQGEAVLTADQNAAMRQGKKGSGNSYTFHVASYGQSPAQLLEMLKREARVQGI